MFLACAFAWLIAGSFAGLISAIKLHQPDWLTGEAWLTFGRIRTLHLNAVAYGWTSMAGLGWMTAVAGLLYQQAPSQLCLNYGADAQQVAGRGLVCAAMVLAGVWLVYAASHTSHAAEMQ